MLRSMFAGVSGLRSHQLMMDVIGNNIANVNTAGYKASQVVFEDLLSQTLRGAGAPQNGAGGTNPAQVGLGVRVAGITTSFTQGASQLTSRPTDLSILGDGFFVVRQGGQSLYTRLGAFSFDSDGRLVNNGGVVQGWMASNGAIDTNAPVTDVQIPLGQTMPPVQTGNVRLGGNLPADAIPGTTLTTAITVYDANGKAVPITFSFVKSAPRQVTDGATTNLSTTLTSATASFTGADVGKAVTGAGIPPGTTIASVTNSTTVVLSNPATATAAGVTVDFAALPNTWEVNAMAPDTSSTMQTIPGFPQALPFNPTTGLPVGGLGSITLNGALNTLLGTSFAPGTIAIDLGSATSADKLVQFAGPSSLGALSQDGASIGTLQSFSIADNGTVMGVFSNGRTATVAQLAVASFSNPAGLEKAGGSMYRVTGNSGLPQVGVPGTGGRGTLSAGTLEMSNVDLAQEFTNLIVAQRGFQANSRVITASDELLQDLVNLKR